MSRTKEPWSCNRQRVRAGIAHGLRMVRLQMGDYHVSVLIDDLGFRPVLTPKVNQLFFGKRQLKR